MRYVRERLLLPFIIPVGAFLVGASIVTSIGLLLLAIGAETRWNLGFFDISGPVVVALLIALAILIVCTVLARGGKGSEGPHH